MGHSDSTYCCSSADSAGRGASKLGRTTAAAGVRRSATLPSRLEAKMTIAASVSAIPQNSATLTLTKRAETRRADLSTTGAACRIRILLSLRWMVPALPAPFPPELGAIAILPAPPPAPQPSTAGRNLARVGPTRATRLLTASGSDQGQ